MKSLVISKCLHSKWGVYLFFALVCFIVYSPVLRNDFLFGWDDHWMVVNDMTLSGWTWENLKRVFFEAHQNQYAPMTELNFLFLYTFFKLDPTWFHLASILWHIGCVILIYSFINKVLMINKEISDTDSQTLGFMTAFLFSIHPMNVEPIAWLSAVKVPIYGFFYLAGLLFYLKYIQNQRTTDYLLVILFFICSCLGKEQAVTFPICLILVDWFTHRDMRSFSLWVEKLMFLCIAIFFGIIAIIAQTNVSEGTYPFKGERIFFVCYSLFEYITKGLFPINLNYLYPYPIENGATLPLRFYLYPLLTIGLCFYLYTLRNNRILMFSVGLFFVNLLFSLNIIDMYRATIVADRYFYLSGIGLILFVCYGFMQLSHKLTITKKWTLKIISIIYICYLVGYSFSYSMCWKNMDTIQMHMREVLDENKMKE